MVIIFIDRGAEGFHAELDRQLTRTEIAEAFQHGGLNSASDWQVRFSDADAAREWAITMHHAGHEIRGRP